jgi:hypothetical protein
MFFLLYILNPGRRIGASCQATGVVRVFLAFFAALTSLSLRAAQPVVAIHDSELTRAFLTTPATNGTPVNPSTTGYQWWITNWSYFVMPDSLKEALRSDGTAFATVSDAQITAGNLLDTNGRPNYPIVISLCSEAMRDDEIAPLTNYVAAGGWLFVGGSSFTRNTDGTTRGDFASGAQMGVHMVRSVLTNWTGDATFSRVSCNPLIAHIPASQLTWQLPSAADEISWPESDHVGNPPTTLLHPLWEVRPGGASVLAQGDAYPYLLIKSYGKGCFIYIAAMEPVIGHGGWAPGMYSYCIIRNAIQQAFAAAQMPIPRVSPWPYKYDAAVIFRHDMEAIPAFIQSIENSARFEFTNGASGDYFFCTGELREDMPPDGPTIASLQRAVSNYNATIGPHNGGFTNINTYVPPVTTNSYDYWHWGPDEVLDTTPTNATYTNGYAYAVASISNSFNDIQGWLGAYTNNGGGLKLWVAPYFNATRDKSYQIEQQLGIQATGEQKAGPFPHWTISTQTPDKLYSFLSVPVSDWFVGSRISQSMEDGYDTNSLHAMVDFYYNLGALINLYSHSASDGSGAAGTLASEYVLYSLAKPRIWPANTAAIYNWWNKRASVTITPAYTTNGTQSCITFAISGSVDTNTAVEVYLPIASYYNLQIFTNGAAAAGTVWRTNGQSLKINVGTSVTNARVLYSLPPAARNDFYVGTEGAGLNVSAPGVLNNDVPGSGGAYLSAALSTDASNGVLNLNASGAFTYTPGATFSGVDNFTYVAQDAFTNSGPAEATLMTVPPGVLFFDSLARPTNTTDISPWVEQLGSWGITNNQLAGATVSNAYGFSYYSNSAWTDYTVQATVQFSNTNGWGGGVGGRLDPATGAHYAAWVYPEGSPGGQDRLKLIKFEGWTLWSFMPMADIGLPAVGTNAHALKITFKTNYITVSIDGTPQISLQDVNYDSVPPLTGGGIVAEMFNGGINYSLAVNNVSATPLTQPEILGVSLTNNAATVTWTSIPTQTYQLQYKDSITATNWNNIAPNVSATDTNTSATDIAIGPNQRFYRVMLVP